jgi:ABC-2 type transport system permease protein
LSWKLRALVRKEAKELLLEKTVLFGVVLMPLIIFPMVGSLTQVGIQATREAAQSIGVVGWVDEDLGEYSLLLRSFLLRANATLAELSPDEPGKLVQEAGARGASTVIVVPKGFTQNISRGVRGSLKVYAEVKSLTLSNVIRVQAVQGVIDGFRSTLSAYLVSRGGLDPLFTSNPLKGEVAVTFQGRAFAPGALAGLLQTLVFGIPTVVLVVSSSAAMVAATSIGLEKEAKTLELLLSLPVPRASILIGKLVGASMIALIGSISFAVGFGLYLTSLDNGLGGRLAPGLGDAIVLTPQLSSIVLLTIFVTLFFTLTLGLLVGVFAGDVRGAQMLTQLTVFALILPPYFLWTFTDIDLLPAPWQYLLLGDPYTHALRAITRALSQDPLGAILSLAYLASASIAVMAIATRMFAGEKLLTARIPFRLPSRGERGPKP